MSALVVGTPVGALRIVSRDGEIVAVGWGGAADGTPGPDLLAARDQLAAYFAGDLTRFDLPLRPAAEGFPARFRAALLEVRPGETVTYGDLADRLGVNAQAVGRACGANRCRCSCPATGSCPPPGSAVTRARAGSRPRWRF